MDVRALINKTQIKTKETRLNVLSITTGQDTTLMEADIRGWILGVT